jgi:hypothetical protein
MGTRGGPEQDIDRRSVPVLARAGRKDDTAVHHDHMAVGWRDEYLTGDQVVTRLRVPHRQ